MVHRKTSLACRLGNQGGAFSPCNQIIYTLGCLLPKKAMGLFLVGAQAQHIAKHGYAIARGQCSECFQTCNNRGGGGIVRVFKQPCALYSLQWVESPRQWIQICQGMRNL